MIQKLPLPRVLWRHHIWPFTSRNIPPTTCLTLPRSKLDPFFLDLLELLNCSMEMIEILQSPSCVVRTDHQWSLLETPRATGFSLLWEVVTRETSRISPYSSETNKQTEPSHSKISESLLVEVHKRQSSLCWHWPWSNPRWVLTNAFSMKIQSMLAPHPRPLKLVSPPETDCSDTWGSRHQQWPCRWMLCLWCGHKTGSQSLAPQSCSSQVMERLKPCLSVIGLELAE